VPEEEYGVLAEVYEWLRPDETLEPEGQVAAFADVVDELSPGARVLDCAAGTGELAVGLALRGFHVTATDASHAMLERTAALVHKRSVEVQAEVCAWEDLEGRGWNASFDAVFCVGNSLPHAPGEIARRRALAAMASVLRSAGALVVATRNWEALRARGSRLEVFPRLVRRRGLGGVVIYAWTIAEAWEEAHEMDIAVALLRDTGVAVHRERMPFWPFRRETLEAELGAVGLDAVASTWAPGSDRYRVVARRSR
jgi:SAM-dependent methyltransferase